MSAGYKERTTAAAQVQTAMLAVGHVEPGGCQPLSLCPHQGTGDAPAPAVWGGAVSPWAGVTSFPPALCSWLGVQRLMWGGYPPGGCEKPELSYQSTTPKHLPFVRGLGSVARHLHTGYPTLLPFGDGAGGRSTLSQDLLSLPLRFLDTQLIQSYMCDTVENIGS